MSFYGYVRGAHFSKNVKIHISGLGDYSLDSVTRISDPVPIEGPKMKGETEEDLEKRKKKRRTLKDKEKII